MFMAAICDHARKVDEDLYLCEKYKAYCYLDEPDKKRCIELYGDEYSLSSDSISEDEENEEDNIG